MKLCQQFSAILDYPTPLLPGQVKECISLLAPSGNEGVTLLKRFDSFLGQTPMSRVEEIYRSTFDLQAICCPYVGYYLFGEDHRRGLFMAGLQEHYQAYNFSAGNEWPDHLVVMLRFLSAEVDGEEAELIDECILPALKKMIKRFEGTANPYRGVLEALFFIL